MNVTEDHFHSLKDVVKKAGISAREYFESDDFSNEQKADGSIVTKIDKEIETRIRVFVETNFPDDAIIGEEQDNKEGVSGFVWHIDPIDGTDNFLRKIPFCAVSVARLGDTEEDSFAIVYNPITNLTFSSFKGKEAQENEHVLKISPEPFGGRYAITIGRGRTESWMRPASQYLQIALAEKFGKSCAFGSTALELAYVAAGRIDGFLTFGLNSYDYAAGLYLVRAAGGAISVFDNNQWSEWTDSLKTLCAEHGKTIFVSHPDVHESMRDFIGDPKRWASGLG